MQEPYSDVNNPVHDEPVIGPESIPGDPTELRYAQVSDQALREEGIDTVPLGSITKLKREDVRLACDFANLSYGELSAVSEGFSTAQALKAEGYTIAYVTDQATQGQALMATKGQEVVIAFRGTCNSRNVRTDLAAAFNTSSFMPAGRVHGGFYKAFRGLCPGIVEHLRRSGKNVDDIKFTVVGHSLGGALAQIGAWYLHQEVGVPSENLRVITFGSPRVFDLEQAKAYDDTIGANTLRLVQEGDPVPSVSPKHWGYHQGGLMNKYLIAFEASNHKDYAHF